MRKALLAAILADPVADLPRLAYADWLDENNQPELARAYRWAVKRRKSPLAWRPASRSPDEWVWDTSRRRQGLPVPLFMALKGARPFLLPYTMYRQGLAYYRTLPAAYKALAAALAALDEIGR
jgi:uncharacterized protein (TIGR02996 family)